jgi:glycosyltransferase involved in cell wall biosynthesis
VNNAPIGDVFVELPKHSRKLASKILYASRLALGNFVPALWNASMEHAFEQLRHQTFSVIVCHSLDLLPVACKLRDLPQNAGFCKIIMDAREFYPRQYENSAWWRFFFAGLNDYLCKCYLPQADLVFTVSPGLQRGYAEQYGVQCTVLPSYPSHAQLEPHATSASAVRCVHHGMATPGRKLELMIEAVRLLGERFHLDFMLVPADPEYLLKLKRRAAGVPNITFFEPVPMLEIVPYIARYDMGLFLLEPNTFNHRHVLPNKLFEFIQARLAVAIGPSPDMAELVSAHGIGVISPDFTPQAFADTLRTLAPADIDRFKASSHAAAAQFCREHNDEILVRTIQQLMI